MANLRLLAILQTDCPTCRLIAPYLNALSNGDGRVTAISQDGEDATRDFAEQMEVHFPLDRDTGFELSKRFGVRHGPTLYVLDEQDRIVRQEPGFDKSVLNEIAAMLGRAPVATPYDGAPASKPGCTSRHLEPQTDDAAAAALNLHATRGAEASTDRVAGFRRSLRILLSRFRRRSAGGPAHAERVEQMMARPGAIRAEVIARIPPCYGEATVEKIAANAVMAGCVPR